MGPIGVFDSGYGGLTILKALKEELPQYDYLYLGDNARAPYGSRSFQVVYEYTLQAVEELFNRGCELVIIACNTASAKALRTIQQNDLARLGADKRVLGVIRPTTEIVGQFSSTKNIGLLATTGTVQSNSYGIEIKRFSPECKLYQQHCPIWVPLIENNLHQTTSGQEFIKNDLQALLDQEKTIDTIILGCTHYPLVKDFLKTQLSDNVEVISQGEIVAKSLIDYLRRHPRMDAKCTRNATVHYLTTENKSVFNETASLFVGNDVHSEQIVFK